MLASPFESQGENRILHSNNIEQMSWTFLYLCEKLPCSYCSLPGGVLEFHTHIFYLAMCPCLTEDICLQVSTITFYLFLRYLWMQATEIFTFCLCSVFVRRMITLPDHWRRGALSCLCGYLLFQVQPRQCSPFRRECQKDVQHIVSDTHLEECQLLLKLWKDPQGLEQPSHKMGPTNTPKHLVI